MLGLSIWKVAIIGGIVMVLFGRGKVSELMGDVAKGIKSFKKGLADEDTTPATDTAAVTAAPGEPVRTLDHRTPQPAATSSTLADRKIG